MFVLYREMLSVVEHRSIFCSTLTHLMLYRSESVTTISIFISYIERVSLDVSGHLSIDRQTQYDRLATPNRNLSPIETWNLYRTRKLKSSHQRCSNKKGVLKITDNPQENTCAKVSFLIRLQVWHLSDRTSPGDCFWKLHHNLTKRGSNIM